MRGNGRVSDGTQYLIAVISDDESTFPEIHHFLSSSFSTILATNEEKIQALMSTPQLDGIVLDLDSIGDGAGDGIEVLQELRKLRENLILIAVTRSTDRSVPLKASQAGADEFFLAPVDHDELQIVLWRAIEKRALQLEARLVPEQVESKAGFCEMVGCSAAMQRVYQAIQAVADSNATVLVRGESGTGKELVAKAIVETGDRKENPFICLNCSALPDSLMESELFGYEKGAFTGADAAKAGLIEMAHTGTLFLDEITTLDHNLQTKLLRVLQERSVQRLGGRSVKKIDFRLIAATNDDLEDMVRTGRFREDLYYRINVVPIFIPALREREGDLPLLVDHFLRVYCAANRKQLKQLQPDVIEILEDYAWPGNVRELENIVQRLVVMNDSPIVAAHHLPQQLLYSSTASQEAILIPEDGVDFDAEMKRIELAYLNAALRRTGGKKSAAAALLHIDPQRMKYLCRTLMVNADELKAKRVNK
jgi:DNA-binding NtrC family response regulator